MISSLFSCFGQCFPTLTANRPQSNAASALISHASDVIDLSLIYHEAPDQIIELIVSRCSDIDQYGQKRGGLNNLRLASKRLKRMVESCATRLSSSGWNGPTSIPMGLERIEHIESNSHFLESLEGCPDGLKSLKIEGRPLKSLEPLRRCTQMESFLILGGTETSDLSPLITCTRLKTLGISSSLVTDLSPLLSMPLLEILYISCCESIKSLDLLPRLTNLKELHCQNIDSKTSLLPLVSCVGLKKLVCDQFSVDLEELRKKKLDLCVRFGLRFGPNMQPIDISHPDLYINNPF